MRMKFECQQVGQDFRLLFHLLLRILLISVHQKMATRNENRYKVSLIGVFIVLVVHFQIVQADEIGCGTVNVIQDLIRDGNDTVKGAWPFLVALHQYRGNGSKFLKCGGTIISEKHVLSGITHMELLLFNLMIS